MSPAWLVWIIFIASLSVVHCNTGVLEVFAISPNATKFRLIKKNNTTEKQDKAYYTGKAICSAYQGTDCAHLKNVDVYLERSFSSCILKVTQQLDMNQFTTVVSMDKLAQETNYTVACVVKQGKEYLTLAPLEASVQTTRGTAMILSEHYREQRALVKLDLKVIPRFLPTTRLFCEAFIGECHQGPTAFQVMVSESSPDCISAQTRKLQKISRTGQDPIIISFSETFLFESYTFACAALDVQNRLISTTAVENYVQFGTGVEVAGIDIQQKNVTVQISGLEPVLGQGDVTLYCAAYTGSCGTGPSNDELWWRQNVSPKCRFKDHTLVSASVTEPIVQLLIPKLNFNTAFTMACTLRDSSRYRIPIPLYVNLTTAPLNASMALQVRDSISSDTSSVRAHVTVQVKGSDGVGSMIYCALYTGPTDFLCQPTSAQVRKRLSPDSCHLVSGSVQFASMTGPNLTFQWALNASMYYQVACALERDKEFLNLNSTGRRFRAKDINDVEVVKWTDQQMTVRTSTTRPGWAQTGVVVCAAYEGVCSKGPNNIQVWEKQTIAKDCKYISSSKQKVFSDALVSISTIRGLQPSITYTVACTFLQKSGKTASFLLNSPLTKPLTTRGFDADMAVAIASIESLSYTLQVAVAGNGNEFMGSQIFCGAYRGICNPGPSSEQVQSGVIYMEGCTLQGTVLNKTVDSIHKKKAKVIGEFHFPRLVPSTQYTTACAMLGSSGRSLDAQATTLIATTARDIPSSDKQTMPGSIIHPKILHRFLLVMGSVGMVTLGGVFILLVYRHIRIKDQLKLRNALLAIPPTPPTP